MESPVDIIVTAPDGWHPRLVVEVKIGGDIEFASDRLRRYMQRVGATYGLVVVGRLLRVLRETYESSGSASIQVLGTYSTEAIDALRPPNTRMMPQAAYEFESRVQSWLESLENPDRVEELPEDLRAAVRDHVAPVVEAGTVRAAGPRAVGVHPSS